MLSGFVQGLGVAFILSLFHVNTIILEILQPMIEVTLTNNHYYILFGLIGLIGGAFKSRVSTN